MPLRLPAQWGLGPSSLCPLKIETLNTHSHTYIHLPQALYLRTQSQRLSGLEGASENICRKRSPRTLGETAPRMGVTSRESRHRGKTRTQPELRCTIPSPCLLSPDTHTHTHAGTETSFSWPPPSQEDQRHVLTSHFVLSGAQGSKTRVFKIPQIISADFSPGLPPFH